MLNCQFSHWVDAVILTFSLESEVSFNTIYTYHSQMAQYSAGLREIPLILVGTQDMISEVNPRLIEDARSRLLAAELKCCTYFETCATYGLNVERVFHDGKIFILMRPSLQEAALCIASVCLSLCLSVYLSVTCHPLTKKQNLYVVCPVCDGKVTHVKRSVL